MNNVDFTHDKTCSFERHLLVSEITYGKTRAMFVKPFI